MMGIFSAFIFTIIFCGCSAISQSEDDDVGESSPYGSIYSGSGRHQGGSHAHFDTPLFSSPFNPNGNGGGRFVSSNNHFIHRNSFPSRNSYQFNANDDDDEDGDQESGYGAGTGYSSKNQQVLGDNGSSKINKIHKFVSIHVAPPEDESQQEKPKPIKPPQKQEKHYQIVFIKAPSTSPQEPQEVHLPPSPETKTLVYVLLKKNALNDMVRIKGAPTPKPTPPQVFFIRYKGQSENGKEGDGDNHSSGEYNNGDGNNFSDSDDPEEEYGVPFRQ